MRSWREGCLAERTSIAPSSSSREWSVSCPEDAQGTPHTLSVTEFRSTLAIPSRRPSRPILAPESAWQDGRCCLSHPVRSDTATRGNVVSVFFAMHYGYGRLTSSTPKQLGHNA